MNDPPIPPTSIRPAGIGDAPEIARLLTALAHPTSTEAVETRWDDWSAADNFALVAAQSNGTLAGLATLGRMFVLHRPKPVGRITALVVDAPMQGQGIGRALVAAAEEALARAGCGLVEITSNMRFAEAHRFYKHLGYERTSMRFAKILVPVDSPRSYRFSQIIL